MSVLSQTRLLSLLSEKAAAVPSVQANLDSTIVLRSAELDVTFDLNSDPSEALEQIVGVC